MRKRPHRFATRDSSETDNFTWSAIVVCGMETPTEVKSDRLLAEIRKPCLVMTFASTCHKIECVEPDLRIEVRHGVTYSSAPRRCTGRLASSLSREIAIEWKSRHRESPCRTSNSFGWMKTSTTLRSTTCQQRDRKSTRLNSSHHGTRHPERRDVSHSSGLPCCWGNTPGGRFLFCVYERIDDIRVFSVTAYEPSEE